MSSMTLRTESLRNNPLRDKSLCNSLHSFGLISHQFTARRLFSLLPAKSYFGDRSDKVKIMRQVLGFIRCWCLHNTGPCSQPHFRRMLSVWTCWSLLYNYSAILRTRTLTEVLSYAILMMMMSWCLMSSDVIWHIRDKLWPMPKHGSIKATYVRCMRV